MAKKIWASKDEFEYVALTKENFEGGMNVMRNAFFVDESVCIAVELEKSPGAREELLELCRCAALDGVSVVAVEKSTGKIVGASFNKIQVAAKPGEPDYFTNFAANCKYESSRALVQFMIDSDASCNLFNYYNIDCLMELMFMATLPEYRGKGIARKLTEVSIDLARTLLNGENVKTSIDGKELPLEPVPKVVSAIFTSFITQKLGKKLGFKKTAEISFEKFVFDGKTFASRIGDHTPSTTLESVKL